MGGSIWRAAPLGGQVGRWSSEGGRPSSIRPAFRSVSLWIVQMLALRGRRVLVFEFPPVSVRQAQGAGLRRVGHGGHHRRCQGSASRDQRICQPVALHSLAAPERANRLQAPFGDGEPSARGVYKVRGAMNVVLSLDDTHKRAGLIAASAGNHAQGLAFAAALASTYLYERSHAWRA